MRERSGRRLLKPDREMDERFGQTYVRPRVEETRNKKAWNYGGET
jgi:hypothetical protein